MSEPTMNSWGSQILSGLQLRDYIEMFRQRKWWVLLPTVAVSLCVLVVVWKLPNVYRAETVILVDPQKVPDSYVPTTVSTSISDRLSTVRQEVMSPTQLMKLINTLHLFANLRTRVPDQDLIQRMQKATNIEVVDSGGQRLSAFRIAFHGTDPVQVADVANRLAGMLIERNLRVRQQQFEGTAKFLGNELLDIKKQLEDKEARLQEVKSRYILDLPESKQYHLEALNNLREQLRANQDQVGRAKQSKLYLQSMEGINAPTIDLDAGSGGNSPLQTQVQKLESQLKELQGRYGPNYPDVRKLREQINQLKTKSASEPTAVAIQESPGPIKRKPTRNPVLEAEINKLDQEIQEQTKRQPELEQQIQYHISKLERVPVFEQQIAGVMREYDALRLHYMALLNKKLSAEMASQLETSQEGERFVVLDTAMVPQKPYGPNRPMLAMAGFGVGLLCGLGLAVMMELANESVRHEREAARIVETSVLAAIPKISSRRERLWNQWRTASLLIGTTAVSLVIGMVISHFVGSF